MLSKFNILNIFNGIINCFSICCFRNYYLKFCNSEKDTKIEIQERAIKEGINNRISIDSRMNMSLN